jgi:hypothetical protein
MANKLNGFLNNVGQGLTNPKGNLGDFRHAARMFIDDTFRLAPKQKFLFFVNFEINPAALEQFPQLKNRHLPEINMLCKTADLPQFSASVDVKNQYNRKKVVQTTLDYTPVNITMHDDNQGITTFLLEAYYKYYYRDGRGDAREDAYGARNTYSGVRKYRYGLDNGTVVPFFKNIKLYQLSRQQFTEYTLVNPMIERWGHDSMDYSDSAGVSENTMVINYETVLYDRGRIDEDLPATFATSHYDTVPSPLSVEGGGVANLFGAGGVLDGGSSVLGDVASGDIGLGTLLSTANTVKNAKQLNTENITAEGIGLATSTLSTIGQGASLGGIAGSIIPSAGAGNEGTTVALAPNSDNTGSQAPSVGQGQKLASARGRNTP